MELSKILKFLYSPSGRISRSDFWLKFYIPYFALLFLAERYQNSLGREGAGDPLLIVLGILFIALIVASFFVNAKRFHDRGKSGWWQLGFLIPIIGLFWWFIELGLLKGTEGPNKYGDPVTRPEDTAV